MKKDVLGKVFCCSFLFCLPLFSQNHSSEDKALRRIQDHLLLRDHSSALREAELYCQIYPTSFPLYQAYLRALCELGQEQKALSTLRQARALAGAEDKERELFELMAWGVLSKGEGSGLLMVRLYSLLGAAFTSDAKALPLLQKELGSSNALLRSIAVKISANYGDIPLKQILLKMLEEEKVWYVRLEVIAALGKLRVEQARPRLKQIVASLKTLPEEKAAALIALTSMYETVEEKELLSLIHSDRAGFRELAAQLTSFWDLHERLSDLLPLLSDVSPSVRVSVLNALALSGEKQIQGQPLFSLVQKMLSDPCPEVAITAAWLAAILGHEEGKNVLCFWIHQPIHQWKRLASAALAATGSHGVRMSQQILKEETDIYVKANLALGLIGQRQHVDLAGQAIYSMLSDSRTELWMWETAHNPLFRSLAPSKLRHIDQVPRYPQAVDQHVKLDLLSTLSKISHPRALDAVKSFLKDPLWGVSSTAMITLLQEGDDQSLDVIKMLLDEKDQEIRLQAALILAMHGSDPQAIGILHKAYPSLDREAKIHVLEALARVGDPSSIPFLLGILEDPFQILRVIAASAMIQCIYH